MTEQTVDQIMQKLLGEFRSAIRADLRRLQAVADYQNIIDNGVTYPIISTKAQFENMIAYNDALQTAKTAITTETNRVNRQSKQIFNWLSNNNFPTGQVFRIPFDNETTVDVRIITDEGLPTLDHSLDPDSELYTP